MNQNELYQLSRRIAITVKRRYYTDATVDDLTNEAFLAASQHNTDDSLAAFWAYKKAKRLACKQREYSTCSSRAIDYIKQKSSSIAISSIDAIIDLIEVTSRINSYDKVLLYNRYVEDMTVKDIARQYKKSPSVISRRITSLNELIREKLK